MNAEEDIHAWGKNFLKHEWFPALFIKTSTENPIRLWISLNGSVEVGYYNDHGYQDHYCNFQPPLFDFRSPYYMDGSMIPGTTQIIDGQEVWLVF